MAVLLNYKICDNAAECGGIEICPTGALFWNEANEKIEIDNNLCISCRNCVAECPVGAIQVAATDEEYESIKTDIDNDQPNAASALRWSPDNPGCPGRSPQIGHPAQRTRCVWQALRRSCWSWTDGRPLWRIFSI